MADAHGQMPLARFPLGPVAGRGRRRGPTHGRAEYVVEEVQFEYVNMLCRSNAVPNIVAEVELTMR